MAQLDEQIALSLYDRMLNVITGRDPSAGLPSAFDSSQTTFVMAQRGLVLNGADYRNPWSPGNTGGKQEATANIATLVDDIPAPSPLWSPTGRKVSQVYEELVNLVRVHEPPPSPAIQAERDRASAVLSEEGKDDEGRPMLRPTQLADREVAAFNAYQDAYTAYIATWAAAMADPNLKRVWPMTGPSALSKVKRAWQDWAAAGRDQVAAAKARLATLNEGQVARVFSDAQWRLNAYKLLTETEQETFYRTKIAPSDWASATATSWPSFHFQQGSYESQFSAEANSYGGKANVYYGLWHFGGGGSHTDSEQRHSVESTNIGISFKWRVCPIYRPWMDATLFKLPNWDLGTMTGRNGIAGSAGSLMPLIPAAMVLVRDVEITGNWSRTDSSHIETATSGSVDVGWGPFGVSGNYSHSSTKDRYTAKKTSQGFRIPDIQVLGWVCSKVPACPPLP